MKTKIYTSLLLTFSMLLFSGFGFTQTDRYVATTGNDGNTGGSGDPWLTIQHAIDNSVSTDIIHVAAGTYTQDISIPAGKSLELIGEGAGYTSIIQGVDRLPAASWPLADPNIEILGNGTVIHGFTIKNPAWLDGFYSSGIVIGATDVEIYNNAFQVAGSDDFDDVSQGLQTYATMDISGLNIHDNTFTDLAVSNAGYEGIYINKNVGVGTVTIDANTFSGDVLRAISTEASNSTISDNSITTDLAPYPTGAGGWGGYQGINITAGVAPLAVSTVTVTGNTVTGLTTADGFGYGLVVGTSTTTNTFTGISIANNFIYGHTVGIRVRDDAGGVTISNNSIHTNSSYCVKNDDPALTALVANCNWWGTLGFNVSSLVSGNVTRTTYLENGTDNSGNPGFQPAASCGSVICSTPPNYNFTVTPAQDTWTTHSETLISNSCAVYKLSCTNGMEYTFKTGCGNSATANFDTYMELYNAAGTSLSTNDDGCEQYRSKITWTASATAVYYIKVRGYNSTKYGTYTMAYNYVDPSSQTGCKTPPLYNETLTAPTTSWLTDPGTIAAGNCYVYKVALTSGQTYTFQTGCSGGGATATFDTYLELYNASGTFITGNDDGCEQGRSKIIYTATGSADFYLKIRGYNSASAGSYTLAYLYGSTYTGCKVPPLWDYAITPSDGSWTTTVTRTINPAECHVYEVTLAAATSYTFKTGCDGGAAGDDATASFDTFLELYNSTGVLIQSNDDGCENGRSKITYTASGPGTVYLKVRGYNLSSTGTYAMAYIRGTGAVTCPTPPAYTSGATLTPTTSWQTTASTTITTDACYVYQVGVTSGLTYTFKTGCDGGEAGDDATASFDTFLELYNSTGVWIMQDDDGCENGRSKITWTATSTTTVYLKVRGYNSSSTGTYALAYREGSGAVACMTPPGYDEIITPNNTDWQSDAETIAANACRVYKISLSNGEIYTFKTGCGNSATANFDTWMDLYDATGAWIQSNDDACESGRSKITYTAPGNVVVYLKVRGYNWAGGTYTMKYRYGTEAVTCLTPPLYNESLVDPTTSWQSPVESGVITSESCRVYRVAVTIGDVYTFKTGCGNSATASFDSFLELYNSTGVWITQDDDGCESGRSKITWTATYSGNAYLKVRGYNAASTGTFTLKYAKGTGAVDCLTPPLFDEVLNFTQMSWANTTGSIASGECIVYKVDSIKTGVVFTFKTGCENGATAGFDTYLQLYNAAGTSLAYNDDGCENGRSIITWTGTYGTGSTSDIAYLMVRGYAADDAGSFTLASNYTGTKEVTLTSGEVPSPDQRVKVYPNPANQLFTIVSEAPLSFTRITLCELTGRLVRSWSMESPVGTFQINSTDFAPGTYVLSIESSEGWIRKKVSIIR